MEGGNGFGGGGHAGFRIGLRTLTTCMFPAGGRDILCTWEVNSFMAVFFSHFLADCSPGPTLTILDIGVD